MPKPFHPNRKIARQLGRLHRAEKLARTEEQRERIRGKIEEITNRLEAERSPTAQLFKTIEQLLTRDSNSEFKLGFVIDAYPYIRLYRVLCSTGIVICKVLARGANTLFGVVDADTYAPGSLVWFFHPTGSQYGIILGSDPAFQTGYYALNDAIYQTSGVGFKYEAPYRFPFFNRSVALADFSNRGPEDSTSGGEFCRISETGSMIFLDPYMASMRMSEICGIWMFLFDMLLRIVGHNYQLWTSICEESHLHFLGQSLFYRGLAMCPHEQLGYLGLNPLTAPSFFTEHIPPIALKHRGATRISHKKPWAPSVHRYQELFSALFGGYRRSIIAPQMFLINIDAPDSKDPVKIIPGFQNNIEDDTFHDPYRGDEYRVGLFSEVLGLNGKYGVQSASGIYLFKSPKIPVLERKKPVNDKNVCSYEKQSSLIYKIATEFALKNVGRADIEIVGIDDPGIREEAKTVTTPLALSALFYSTVLEGYRYLNDHFELIHPFAMSHSRGIGNFVSVFNEVENDIKIDFNTNYAYISLNENGTVVIEDGWGSSIRMANGKIYLDADHVIINSKTMLFPCADSIDIKPVFREKRISDEDMLRFDVREYYVPQDEFKNSTNMLDYYYNNTANPRRTRNKVKIQFEQRVIQENRSTYR